LMERMLQWQRNSQSDDSPLQSDAALSTERRISGEMLVPMAEAPVYALGTIPLSINNGKNGIQSAQSSSIYSRLFPSTKPQS
jgi:hypothetical protein